MIYSFESDENGAIDQGIEIFLENDFENILKVTELKVQAIFEINKSFK